MQPALPVDLCFAPPVVSRRIQSDSRINREILAVAATGLPALTVEGVGAVAGKELGVVEGEVSSGIWWLREGRARRSK